MMVWHHPLARNIHTKSRIFAPPCFGCCFVLALCVCLGCCFVTQASGMGSEHDSDTVAAPGRPKTAWRAETPLVDGVRHLAHHRITCIGVG